MSAAFLLLDQGNTRLKFRFIRQDGFVLDEGAVLNAALTDYFLDRQIRPDIVMMVRSGPDIFDPRNLWPEITPSFPEPQDAKDILWAYQEMKQMGRDRIAAIMGAREKFPESNLVIADAGTCLTVDYLSADGRHLGGFISPGYAMRFQAMHTFTHSLPLISQDVAMMTQPGKSTQDCMVSGAAAGMLAELDFHFQRQIFPPSETATRILTGGDAKDLAHHLKGSTFVAEDLIFRGLFQACLNRFK